MRQCTKRARRKFGKVGIIVRALLIPTRDGVHEAMAALVHPAQFWCRLEIGGAQVWRGVPALWFTICTRSLVHYALSDAIMTRASELAVLVSWPQFTGVGCALCSLQFAWSAWYRALYIAVQLALWGLHIHGQYSKNPSKHRGQTTLVCFVCRMTSKKMRIRQWCCSLFLVGHLIKKG